jgi:tetratricopeptide (TPR) repeat protein
MRQSPIHALERDEFLSLAEQCGLSLKGEELDALVHHKLLVPLRAGAMSFCALHLYVLAQYDEHVRPPQHPWRAKPLADLAGVKRLAVQVAELADGLRGDREPPAAARIEELAFEMERYLASLDPFGPLGDVLDLLREDVMARLRGVGRRYVELRWAAGALAAMVEQYAPGEEPEPMTRPVESEELDESGVETSEPVLVLEEVASETAVAKAPALAPASEELGGASGSVKEIPKEDEAVGQFSQRSVASSDDGMGAGRDGEHAGEFDAEPTRLIATQLGVQAPGMPAAAPVKPVMADVAPSGLKKTQMGIGTQALKLGAGAPPAEHGARVTAELEAFPKRPTLEMRKPQPTPPPLTSLNVGRRGEPNPFSRDANQATAPNNALRERLGALRTTAPGGLAQPGKAGAATREVGPEERDELMVQEPTSALAEPTVVQPEPSATGELEAADVASNGLLRETRQEMMPEDDLDAKPTSMLQTPQERTSPLDEPSIPNNAPPSAEELAARVQHLNKLREQYIKAQDWAALAALYEDGVGLFDPTERAQIFETLSKLYEVKLKDPERAWQSLERAWHSAQDEASRRRVWAGVERLGMKRGEAWVSWLEGEIARGSAQGELRLLLQRALAFGLKALGQDGRAFLVFAAYLADHPDTGIKDETLDALESLVTDGEVEELYAFYDDLLETRQGASWVGALGRRAGRMAAKRGDEARATRYWSQSLVAEAPSEALLDEIETFYQERGKRTALVKLLDGVLAQRPAHAAKLEQALESALEAELAHPEAAMHEYSGRLEQDPADALAYERLMRFYQLHQRYAEAYAFLNRHLERVSEPARRVMILEEMAQIAQRHLMEPGEAALHYEEALEVGGPRRRLLEALARVRLEQGQWKEAERAIGGLFDGQGRWTWTPEDVVYWGMLGALAGQRLSSDARRRWYLERVLEANPDHRDARAALDALG